jgi:hypothetical protein
MTSTETAADGGSVDSCTIVCKTDDRDGALSCVYCYVPVAPVVTGPEDRWQRVELTTPRSTLALTAMVYERGGDRFSRTLLGLGTFVRRIETPHTTLRGEMERRASAAKLLIGVTARPSFSEEDGHQQCIFEIADRLDGMVFDGRQFLDGSGALLLDADGASETA